MRLHIFPGLSFKWVTKLPWPFSSKQDHEGRKTMMFYRSSWGVEMHEMSRHEMVALYTAYLPRPSPRDESLSNKALSPKWRWYHDIHVVISIGDDSIYNGVSALGDVTKTRNHLHRDDDVYLRVVISRDEGLLFKVSSPEMTERFSRYHLQRWRLGKHGIISRIVGQR